MNNTIDQKMVEDIVKYDIYVDTFWLTRGESLSIVVDGEKSTRDVSMGMTAKSDKKARAKMMYSAIALALDDIMNTEYETWMNREKIKISQRKLEESINEETNIQDKNE